MKTTQVKTLFIALLLSTAVPSLPTEDAAHIIDKLVSDLGEEIWRENDLSKAVKRGDVAGVERALAAGSNVNQMISHQNDDDVTPLMIAVSQGNLEIIKLLVNYNADVNKKKYLISKSPLSTAILDDRLEVLRLLIENSANGADVNSGLWIALMNGHLEAAELLIENGGADINWQRADRWQNKTDKTLLMYVAESNLSHKNTVKFLLAKNVDINRKDSDGEIALQYAIKHRNTLDEYTIPRHYDSVKQKKDREKYIAELKEKSEETIKSLKKTHQEEIFETLDKELKKIGMRDEIPIIANYSFDLLLITE